MRRKSDIVRFKKSKRIRPQRAYPRRIAKEVPQTESKDSFLKKETLEHQEGRKNTISKNMSK